METNKQGGRAYIFVHVPSELCTKTNNKKRPLNKIPCDNKKNVRVYPECLE